MIFFRYFVERPAKIFTRSIVIGLLSRHEQRLRETAKNDNSAWEIESIYTEQEDTLLALEYGKKSLWHLKRLELS